MQITRTQGPRTRVRFASGDSDCVAWHYPGSTGACVVMAGGLGVTKEPATDRFAWRFHDSGFSVLAFDHRGLGESGGRPRQVTSVRSELTDWRAALDAARGLPEVDPGRVALWGFSSAGGHVVRVAARNPDVAAVIAQSPNLDGVSTARNAARHQSSAAMAKLFLTALADAAGGLLGRAPRLVPLAGEPGTLALLTTPDANQGAEVLNPDHRYPDWVTAMAARTALAVPAYRPVRHAGQVSAPLLLVVADGDQSAPASAAFEAARRAPAGQLHLVGGDHYAPFTESHEIVVEAELAFLRRHLLAERAR